MILSIKIKPLNFRHRYWLLSLSSSCAHSKFELCQVCALCVLHLTLLHSLNHLTIFCYHLHGHWRHLKLSRIIDKLSIEFFSKAYIIYTCALKFSPLFFRRTEICAFYMNKLVVSLENE